jgi:hypothetical protein
MTEQELCKFRRKILFPRVKKDKNKFHKDDNKHQYINRILSILMKK